MVAVVGCLGGRLEHTVQRFVDVLDGDRLFGFLIRDDLALDSTVVVERGLYTVPQGRFPPLAVFHFDFQALIFHFPQPPGFFGFLMVLLYDF